MPDIPPTYLARFEKDSEILRLRRQEEQAKRLERAERSQQITDIMARLAERQRAAAQAKAEEVFSLATEISGKLIEQSVRPRAYRCSPSQQVFVYPEGRLDHVLGGERIVEREVFGWLLGDGKRYSRQDIPKMVPKQYSYETNYLGTKSHTRSVQDGYDYRWHWQGVALGVNGDLYLMTAPSVDSEFCAARADTEAFDVVRLSPETFTQGNDAEGLYQDLVKAYDKLRPNQG